MFKRIFVSVFLLTVVSAQLTFAQVENVSDPAVVIQPSNTGSVDLGDTNGDGKSDLAFWHDGTVYVLLEVPAAEPNIEDVSYKFLAEEGNSVSRVIAVGDVNGDKLNDILILADSSSLSLDEENALGMDKAYLILGSKEMISQEAPVKADAVFQMTADNEPGFIAANAVDIDADGINDILFSSLKETRVVLGSKVFIEQPDDSPVTAVDLREESNVALVLNHNDPADDLQAVEVKKEDDNSAVYFMFHRSGSAANIIYRLAVKDMLKSIPGTDLTSIASIVLTDTDGSIDISSAKGGGEGFLLIPGNSKYAEITSPIQGALITTQFPTIKWIPPTSNTVSYYELKVAIIGPPYTSIYTKTAISASATQETLNTADFLPGYATGVPLNGSGIHVRLYTYGTKNGQDYKTYVSGVKAVITNPAPGAQISASSKTFKWTAGSVVTSYKLSVGTNGAGSTNIVGPTVYPAGTLNTVVTGIPMTGGTVYVRLGSMIGGTNFFKDYTYLTFNPASALMITPVAGATLSAPTVFTWSAGTGVTQYKLMIGDNAGGGAIYNNTFPAGTLSSPSISFTLNGQDMYVRLYSKIGGVWSYKDYVYHRS